MNSFSIMVLLPAYNEEVTISITIRKIKEALPNASIVVVDNGSSDETFLRAKDAGVTVIREKRQGKGYAVQLGFDYFIKHKFDCCFLVDADDTYGLDNITQAIQSIFEDGIDMVVGTRVVDHSDHEERNVRQIQFRPGHQIGNRAFVFLQKSLLGGNIEDVLSGWRVMSRRFIASFPGGSKGFEIESQLNSHAVAIDALVSNTSVRYQGRPDGSHSKLNTYTDGYRILKSTLRSFKEDRPLLAFSMLSIPWISATTWLVYLPFKTYLEIGLVPNLPRLVTGVGTFLIAALLWVTGMIIERVRQIRITVLLHRYHSNF